MFSVVPGLVAARVEVKVEVDSPIFGGSATLTIIGPVDTDRDGDPEFFVGLTGPITVPSTKIEVPLKTALGPLTGLVSAAVAQMISRGLLRR